MKGIVGKGIIAAAFVLFAASGLFHFASAVEALPFNDISDSYAKDEIIFLHENGIINGTTKTTFSPADHMTRAEFITMVDRLLKLEPVTGPVNSFKDVTPNQWYYGWIQAAVQLELASGTSATTFSPDAAVTRQEAAVWIARAFKQSSGQALSATAFKDTNDIAQWANTAVSALQRQGLMKGDDFGRFRPADAIKRQEAAVLIARVLQQESWAAELDKKVEERIVLGWQYGQTTAAYEKNILNSNVNTLSPRWYFVDGAGKVSDNTDTSLIAWAKANGKKVWAMVGNRFDQEATHQMLSNSEKRNAVIDQLAAKVSKYSLDGLNIDFENVAPKDKANLTLFIADLAKKLDEAGAALSVDVSPDLGTDWTEALDYKALGEHADYIVMMGYDEHYGGSINAGSVASLPFVHNAITKLLKAVPSEKVILAMPLYSRDWTLLSNGKSAGSTELRLHEQNAMIASHSLKPIWNKSVGQYVASYTKQSKKHTIWLEDGRSLIAKYKVVAEQDLAGIAYWHIGGDSPDIWTSMRNAERFYDYTFSSK